MGDGCWLSTNKAYGQINDIYCSRLFCCIKAMNRIDVDTGYMRHGNKIKTSGRSRIHWLWRQQQRWKERQRPTHTEEVSVWTDRKLESEGKGISDKDSCSMCDRGKKERDREMRTWRCQELVIGCQWDREVMRAVVERRGHKGQVRNWRVEEGKDGGREGEMDERGGGWGPKRIARYWLFVMWVSLCWWHCGDPLDIQAHDVEMRPIHQNSGEYLTVSGA